MRAILHIVTDVTQDLNGMSLREVLFGAMSQKFDTKSDHKNIAEGTHCGEAWFWCTKEGDCIDFRFSVNTSGEFVIVVEFFCRGEAINESNSPINFAVRSLETYTNTRKEDWTVIRTNNTTSDKWYKSKSIRNRSVKRKIGNRWRRI